jgi:serine/threonine-protein kinase
MAVSGRDVLNMSGRNPESVFFGPFRFVPGDGLWRDARAVPLPPRALGVLTALIAAPGEVVSKQQLMDAVWPGTFVTESSLLEAIGLLRDTLGDDRKQPTYIQTVHRRGYRFIGHLAPAPAPDARLALVAPIAPIAPVAPVAPIAPVAPVLPVALVFSAIAILCVAIVWAAFLQRPTERRTSRFSISLPDDAMVDPMRGSVAVSLDGSRLVYVAMASGRSQLFLRSVDRDAPTAIDGTEDAADPFFSPDGEWIGFFAHGSLQKIRVTGGRPIILCAARAGAGATWTADNTIVFGGGPGGGLARVSAFANSITIGAPADTHRSAGAPVVIATPAEGSRDIRFGWPDVLPGDRGVLFTSITLAGSDVGVIDLRTGARTLIAEHAAFARYLPSGHIVFERQGRLEAARFSLATLAATTAPTPIVSGVSRGDILEGPRFAFSKSGAMLVYVPAAIDEQDAPLHWLDARGQLERVPLPATGPGSIDISPNRQQLALTMDGESGPSVWVGDTRQGDLRRFISDGQSVSPAWRPDGREIAYAFSKAGPFNLFIKPVDGRAAAPLSASPFNQFPTSWLPDASRLAFTEFQPLTGADIWVLDLATGQRRALVRTLFDETWARFSPDGRWIAYMSNESGRWEIYARPSNGDGARVRVSTAGGVWPCWSLDGKTIYFSANGRTLASALQTSPDLIPAAPVNVAGADAMVLAGGATAGDRLLVRRAGAPAIGRAELRVVLEWFSEITKRQS